MFIFYPIQGLSQWKFNKALQDSKRCFASIPKVMDKRIAIGEMPVPQRLPI
jgi:hypothetical protein